MKYYFLLAIFMIPLFSSGQEDNVDPVAVRILDHMNDVIGELTACSYNLSSSQDILDPDYGMIKSFTESHVIMMGPDKLLVKTTGNKGNRGFWYNGEDAIFYSFSQNNYAIMDAPDNIIAVIDSVSTKYDIEIPAADFFYPSFTDDILDSFDTVKFLGVKYIKDQACYHIKTANKDMEVQYWIADDAYNLPKRYLIIYKDQENMQYQGTFDNWTLNPVIPESVFEFEPPAKAKEIKILARK